MNKASQKGSGMVPAMVDFSYDNTSYQIDTKRRKVYRRWVEVESARTYLIMSAWSALDGKKAL